MAPNPVLMSKAPILCKLILHHLAIIEQPLPKPRQTAEWLQKALQSPHVSEAFTVLQTQGLGPLGFRVCLRVWDLLRHFG